MCVYMQVLVSSGSSGSCREVEKLKMDVVNIRTCQVMKRKIKDLTINLKQSVVWRPSFYFLHTQRLGLRF